MKDMLNNVNLEDELNGSVSWCMLVTVDICVYILLMNY